MSALYGIMPPLMAWRLRYGGAPMHGGGADGSAGGGAEGGGCGGGPAAGKAPSALHTARDPAAEQPSAASGATPEVPGGRSALAVLCAAAVAVEVGQAAIDLGWLRLG